MNIYQTYVNPYLYKPPTIRHKPLWSFAIMFGTVCAIFFPNVWHCFLPIFLKTKVHDPCHFSLILALYMPFISQKLSMVHAIFDTFFILLSSLLPFLRFPLQLFNELRTIGYLIKQQMKNAMQLQKNFYNLI